MEDWEKQAEEQVHNEFENFLKDRQELIDICSCFSKEFPNCEILYKRPNQIQWLEWQSSKYKKKGK